MWRTAILVVAPNLLSISFALVFPSGRNHDSLGLLQAIIDDKTHTSDELISRGVFNHVANSFHVLAHEDFDPFDPPITSLVQLIKPDWHNNSGVNQRVDRKTARADRLTSKPDDYHKNFAVNNPHMTKDTGGINFFRSANWDQWVVLAVVCSVLLVIDSFVFARCPQNFKWHIFVIICWIILAVAYDMWVEGTLGNRRAFEWIYGYMLEWLLSMDNLFVFHLVFTVYKTPQSHTRKAVFVGIFCAVIFRLLFFLVVATLLHAFGWVRWPIGALLVYSGVCAVWGDDDDDTEVQDTMTVWLLKKVFGNRLKDHYTENPDLIAYDEQGRWQLTMLFIVVAIIELSDVIFALDSVSAKTAQIPDQYIAFSSSILAMYALRAMFFVIQDLVEMFDLLKYGLALILVYIGVELMFANFFHLSKGLTCLCIIGVFVLCIGGSVLQKKISNKSDDKKPAEFPTARSHTFRRRSHTEGRQQKLGELARNRLSTA